MTSRALSPRQSRFVLAYCGHLNASRAAREAGYSSSSGADAVTGHRLLRNAKTRRAIEALKQAKAVEMELDRDAIIQAILGAIQTAQEQGAPATMIRGWVEIARMCGFDDPAVGTAEADDKLNSNALRYLPTAELCRRISEVGEFRNEDGSAMTAGQLDAFYQSLSEVDLKALAEGRARVATRVERLA